MFDALNTFWGGVVTLASGLIVLHTLFKVLTVQPRKVVYDFRSSKFSAPKLPADFEVFYSHHGQNFPSIHKTEIIIKNETDLPLTDTSFLSAPKLNLGSSTVCAARKIEGIDDSRAKILMEEGGELKLVDLMIPIDSSVTVEIISVTPVDQLFHCVHSNARTVQRNYGSYLRSRDFLISAPLLVFIFSLLLTAIVSRIHGGNVVISYLNSVKSGLNLIGIFAPFDTILTMLHSSLLGSGLVLV